MEGKIKFETQDGVSVKASIYKDLTGYFSIIDDVKFKIAGVSFTPDDGVAGWDRVFSKLEKIAIKEFKQKQKEQGR